MVEVVMTEFQRSKSKGALYTEKCRRKKSGDESVGKKSEQKWQQLKEAIIYYKGMNGHVKIPGAYKINKSDGPNVPEILFKDGANPKGYYNLGCVLKNVKSGNQYRNHWDELTKMGLSNVPCSFDSVIANLILREKVPVDQQRQFVIEKRRAFDQVAGQGYISQPRPRKRKSDEKQEGSKRIRSKELERTKDEISSLVQQEKNDLAAKEEEKGRQEEEAPRSAVEERDRHEEEESEAGQLATDKPNVEEAFSSATGEVNDLHSPEAISGGHGRLTPSENTYHTKKKMNKLRKPVPAALDLTKICTGLPAIDGKYLGLNGVIIHEGCTGNKGHYTYQLLIDSNWFELDDESIKYVDHSQAMENNRQGTLYIYTQDKQVQEVNRPLPTQTRSSGRLQSNNHSNTTPETKSNPNLPARLCGLVNKGVDCYANASIQCLLSLEKVSEYMDKDNNGGDNLLISTFRRLKVEYDKKKNVCAQEFINMMISKHPNELESGRQCMASDFLSLAIKDLGIGELFNYEFHSKVDCHTCGPTVDGTAFIHKAETFLYVNPSRNSLLETLIKNAIAEWENTITTPPCSLCNTGSQTLRKGSTTIVVPSENHIIVEVNRATQVESNTTSKTEIVISESDKKTKILDKKRKSVSKAGQTAGNNESLWHKEREAFVAYVMEMDRSNIDQDIDGADLFMRIPESYDFNGKEYKILDWIKNLKKTDVRLKPDGPKCIIDLLEFDVWALLDSQKPQKKNEARKLKDSLTPAFQPKM